MTCEWCVEGNVRIQNMPVYWELPDGSRAIEISDTPTCICEQCGMEYQEEMLIKKLENHLYLVDFKKIPASISYEELINLPKILKKNYFDFTS